MEELIMTQLHRAFVNSSFPPLCVEKKRLPANLQPVSQNQEWPKESISMNEIFRI